MEMKSFGGFDLHEKIGSGGMASVYRATQRSLNRPVVLKILHPHLAESEDFVLRFEREARAAAALRHECIVQMIDYGRQDETAFIAMEYIQGTDLRQILEKAGLPPVPIAMLLVREVCRGLDHAHTHGVVHRDIKPANLMLSTEGFVKITDFGLARSAEDSHLTVSGSVLGTPAYVSPEQGMGTPVDQRSDIFSLGVVAYELLGGERPFKGPSYSAILNAVLTHDPEDLATLRPNVPGPVSAVVHRMLEKEVARRYASARDVQADLERQLGREMVLNVRELLRDYAADPRRPLASGGDPQVATRVMSPVETWVDTGSTTRSPVTPPPQTPLPVIPAAPPEPPADSVSRAPAARPERRGSRTPLIALVGVILVLAAVGAFWKFRNRPEPVPAPAASIPAEPPAPAPSPLTGVQLLAPSGETASSIELSWMPYSNADFVAYEVHRSKTAGFAPSDESRMARLENQSATSQRVDGLQCGARYYFKVRVVGTQDRLADSNERSASTLDCPQPVANAPVTPPPPSTPSPDRPAPAPQLAGMVLIRPGTFTMGSPAGEAGRDQDEAQRQVTLARSFLMLDHEVTQAEWLAVLGRNPSQYQGDENRPVEQVSWYDAVEFCNKRSALEGLTPAYEVSGTTVTWNREANGYRLPTEAEWEYACRAGSATAFPNGDITKPTDKDLALNRLGWFDHNSKNVTHPIKGKPPNTWGLHDMNGNVDEWCWDAYKANLGTSSVIDPAGPAGSDRVVRGGRWSNSAQDCRCANRKQHAPGDRGGNVGFRVVKTAG